MTSPALDAVALADACRLELASEKLSPAAARLYSQHTRLRLSQPTLARWSAAEAATHLENAARLMEAGTTLLDAGHETGHDCLRRAAELLEWLNHPEIGLQRVPFRLLSAGVYLQAGYPARAEALLRETDETTESDVLRSFFRGHLTDTLAAITSHWTADSRRGTATLAEPSEEAGPNEFRSMVVAETLGAIGIVCAAMRWGDMDRVGAAVAKLRSVGRLLAHSADRHSWLLAKVVGETAQAYETCSLRSLLRSFQSGLNTSGQAALERYLRLGYLAHRQLAWPSQQRGIRRLVEGRSFALCTPTGSGKTTVAELAIVQSLFGADGPGSSFLLPLALYLVPSRALAAEVEAKLTHVFRRLKTERVVVTGLYGGADWGPTDAWLTADERTILICTYEKAEALMRFLGPLFLDRVRLVVLDEAHGVQFQGQYDQLRAAENRALRLEVLGMRLLKLLEGGAAKVIALSAVAAGIDDALQHWVGHDSTSAPVRTTYRSTRQLIGRLEYRADRSFSIHYDLMDGADLRFGGTQRSDTPFVPRPFPAQPPAPDWEKTSTGPEKRLRPAALWAALNFATPDADGKRHGVLISIPQGIQHLAADFVTLLMETWGSQTLPDYFAHPQGAEQLALWDRCLRTCEDYFGRDSSEFCLLERGIAVHHGDLPSLLGRTLVEVVQAGIISVVVATSTLSEGVNLPVETVLLPTFQRRGAPLPSREFANLAGRAGRPGVGTEGRTLVLLSEESRGGRHSARGRYFQLVQELQVARPQAGVSPLAELLEEIWRAWQALSPSSDRAEFNNWLEVAAPVREKPSALTGGIPPALEALDTLDGVLLSALVEGEELTPAVAAEDNLRSVWRHSFAACAGQREDLEAVFLRRGVAIPKNIFPNGQERRRLYRAGLPPRSAFLLLEVFPAIREHLKGGQPYAAWPRAERLAYVLRIVELVGSVDRFRYVQKVDKQVMDWRRVLEWWLCPRTAPVQPPVNQRANWFHYARQNFGYRFAWGLGSVLGLIADELHQGQLHALRLEDWPRTGLPWAAFWLKELITWGTLEPVAAYLLGRGLADTRTAAEGLAAAYYEDWNSKPPPPDLLDVTVIRRWADATVQLESEPDPPRPLPAFPAELALKFDEPQKAKLWRVLPVPRPDSVEWYDPAGFLLARSPDSSEWPSEHLHSADFQLDPARQVVEASWYV